MALLHFGHAGCIALQQALEIRLAILVVGQVHEGLLDMTDFTVRNFQVAIQVVTDAPPEVVQSHQALPAALCPLIAGQAAVCTIHTSAAKGNLSHMAR